MKFKSNPLVSILTPTWNRASYLERVWEGISSQSYSEIEWIIANDGSTDDTTKVCLELKKRSKFKVIIIESNIRVGKPRMDNELIKTAKGDYIIWCDSDDYLLPNAVERLINVWKSMSLEDQQNFIGLTALCATKEGVLQSVLPSKTGVFDTTWSELDEIYNANGDMLIFFNKEIIKNSRFIEVDFMVSESSLWLNFFEMKTKFIPEVLKIMDRGVFNRISFSGKMEYCRGKAYSISTCEKIKPTSQGLNKNFIWKLITYHRYCIHGDIKIFKARKLWGEKPSFIFWYATYSIGLIFALKDLVQRKVVKTHIEFNKNVKSARIHIIN